MARDAYDYERNMGRRPHRRRELAQRKGAPFLLRFLSWMGVILLCFVLGYLGTSWLVNNFLNRQSFLKPENRVENTEDLKALEESMRERESSGSGDGVQKVALNLYYVKDNKVMETQRSFVVRTQEDNIRDAVSAILSLSAVPGADKIQVLHVFRNINTVFLDLSSSFVSALSSIGQRQSLLLLTGLVRTMQENFSIQAQAEDQMQVRFLIDSKSPAPGGIVDLTVPWKMPSRS